MNNSIIEKFFVYFRDMTLKKGKNKEYFNAFFNFFFYQLLPMTAC